MNPKIKPHHLSRFALVYIRQSTMQQLLVHQESTERQYNLAEHAKRLGWDAAQVQVIDEDLGRSGGSTAQRTGFQRLAGEVSLNKVGAILSLEVSRLARSSADWHRLLDLCAFSNTLIIDDDGVYDPNDFNDRLVLGMKGTMSDAERHVMRLRLEGGKRHKAMKGELHLGPPTGYVIEDKALTLDPDEEVQRAIRLVFKRFRIDGSVVGVVRYFVRHGLLLPARVPTKTLGELRWTKPTTTRVLQFLNNPTYAGAYSWGRTRNKRVLLDGVIKTKRERVSARDQWHAFQKDAHPAYLPWEEYLENLRRLDENAPAFQKHGGRGAPKKGLALLQGLVICGKCGQRMRPHYSADRNPFYLCSLAGIGAKQCWATSARHVDEKFVGLFFEVVSPAEIDLSLATLREVEQQAADVDRQWKLRLDRARYQATRAERQYNAVEPENRVVARTLETRWNERLKELAQVESEYELVRNKKKLTLSDEDRRAILALAKDLPKVWHARTTTVAEKKHLLRLLIQDVVLTPIDVPKRSTRIKVLWKTGATSELVVPRPVRGPPCVTPPEALAAIKELASAHLNDVEVTEELNRRGLKSGRGVSFTREGVYLIRAHYGIEAGGRRGAGKQPVPDRDETGRYSVRGLAKHYKVTEHIVRYWIEKRVVTTERDYTRGPIWIRLTRETRLKISAAMETGYGRQKGKQPVGRKVLPLRFKDGSYSTQGLLKKYGISKDTLQHLMRTKVLAPDADNGSFGHRFTLTPAVERRLEATLARSTRGR